MFAAIKAELRKLFTVRTTFGIAAIAACIVILYAFYIEGIRAGDSVQSAMKLASEIPGGIQAVSALAAVVGLLLMTHEYRYNTIMYTLTSTRRRLTVLLAKVLAVSLFAVLFALLVSVLAPAMAYFGLSIKGLHLAPQQFPLWDLAWQGVFYTWAYSMFGLLFAVLFRSQVASIIVLLFAPGVVESLAGLLLKDNAKYLPFSSMGQVLQAGMHVGPNQLSAGHAAVLVLGYLAFGWVIATILFVRRDAN
jgi:ABC-2 type transport system permease protein